MAQAPAEAPQPNPSDTAGHGGARERGNGGFWALALGSIGVVYGDIGTSPLYALRESLTHVAEDGPILRSDVLGVVSLIFWAIILIVTCKYVLLLTRLNNKGEGGTIALMALAQRAFGKRTPLIFVLGVLGAALFYGDALITPAISVVAAVEGLRAVPGFAGRIDPFILPIAIGILVGLFTVQSRGTGRVGAWFGPITLIWFLVLGSLGIWRLSEDFGILMGLSPTYAIEFMFRHAGLGFIVLGSVFLAVTGAEALYADMGHFGRRPIQMAWMFVVLPSLVLNYLGQGAYVLRHPEALENIFFETAPEALRIPLVIIATMATIIASQAVISGAFSLTQQAIQLEIGRAHV